MSGKRPPSSPVQRSVGGVHVLSFETKALIVPRVDKRPKIKEKGEVISPLQKRWWHFN